MILVPTTGIFSEDASIFIVFFLQQGFFFFFFFPLHFPTTGFHHVSQACLELLTSGDPSASASQSAGITGVSRCAWPFIFTSILFSPLVPDSGLYIHLLTNLLSQSVILFLFLKMGSCYVTQAGQAGFKLLSSSGPPTSAF